MSRVFAPGCALMLYKPQLAEKLHAFLNAGGEEVPMHLTCCRHEPKLAAGTCVVNVCAGCDRRYRELYEGITTVSLWEVLAESRAFPFPDWGGMEVSVLDACPTRGERRVHDAVRALLGRMNIRAVEPVNTRERGTCCGDSFYGVLPVEQVKERMRRRAGEMPREDVAVYCVSCVKAVHIGGRRPRHMADLLFGEKTEAGVYEPDAWHAQLQAYIDAH
jgi:Fe-S oxidoreductase